MHTVYLLGKNMYFPPFFHASSIIFFPQHVIWPFFAQTEFNIHPCLNLNDNNNNFIKNFGKFPVFQHFRFLHTFFGGGGGLQNVYSRKISQQQFYHKYNNNYFNTLDFCTLFFWGGGLPNVYSRKISQQQQFYHRYNNFFNQN